MTLNTRATHPLKQSLGYDYTLYMDYMDRCPQSKNALNPLTRCSVHCAHMSIKTEGFICISAEISVEYNDERGQFAIRLALIYVNICAAKWAQLCNLMEFNCESLIVLVQ